MSASIFGDFSNTDNTVNHSTHFDSCSLIYDNLDFSQSSYTFDVEDVCESYDLATSTEYSALLSFPVGEHVSQAFSELSVQVKTSDILYSDLFPKYLTRHSKTCPIDTSIITEEDNTAFTWTDMSGLFYVFWSFLVAGILYDTIQYLTADRAEAQRRRAENKKPIGGGFMKRVNGPDPTGWETRSKYDEVRHEKDIEIEADGKEDNITLSVGADGLLAVGGKSKL